MPLPPCARSPPHSRSRGGGRAPAWRAAWGWTESSRARPPRSPTTAWSGLGQCLCLGQARRSTLTSARPGRSWARACSPTRSATWSGSLHLRERRSAAVPVARRRALAQLLSVRLRRRGLLARARMPQLGSRLWLDGIVAAPHHVRDQRGGRLRRRARLDGRRHRRGGDEPGLSARRHDPARHRHRRDGRRPRPARPQLAVLRRGDRRLRRHRPDLPASRSPRAPTSSARCSTSAGPWQAAGGHRRLAARRAQALHRRRAAEHHRADRARAGQPRAARLRPLRAASTCSPSRSASAALVAALIRLSLTHRESRANLVTTRVQARTDSLTGLGNRFALQRALERRARRAGAARAAAVRPRRLQELQRLLRAPGRRRAADAARLARSPPPRPPTAPPTASAATSSASSPRGRPTRRPTR